MTKTIKFYLFGSGGQRHEECIKEFPLDYTKEDIDQELMDWVDGLHCHSEYIRFGWEGEADETKSTPING